MKKCCNCGKKGFFLKLNEFGVCRKCEEDFQTFQAEQLSIETPKSHVSPNTPKKDHTTAITPLSAQRTEVPSVESTFAQSSSMTSTLPDALPTKIEEFNEYHIRVLRRLNHHPVAEKFDGLLSTKVDIPSFIPILQQLGLVEIDTYNHALEKLKVADLKQILSLLGLKKTGTKAELVDRILTSNNEDAVRKMDVYSDIYVITELGYKAIDDVTENINRKYNDNFINIINHIMDEDFISISHFLRNDMAKYLEIFKEVLYMGAKLETASAIYCVVTGISARAIPELLQQLYKHDTTTEKILFYESIIHSKINLQQMYNSDIKTYEISACLDECTCDICKRKNKKIYEISSAKIGINCPPFHEGCRCTILS